MGCSKMDKANGIWSANAQDQFKKLLVDKSLRIYVISLNMEKEEAIMYSINDEAQDNKIVTVKVEVKKENSELYYFKYKKNYLYFKFRENETNSIVVSDDINKTTFKQFHTFSCKKYTKEFAEDVGYKHSVEGLIEFERYAWEMSEAVSSDLAP